MRDSSTYTAERPLEIRSDFDLTAFYIILGLSCLPYVLICLSTRRLRIIICVIYFYWQVKFIHVGIFGGSMSDTFVGRPLTLQDAPFYLATFLYYKRYFLLALRPNLYKYYKVQKISMHRLLYNSSSIYFYWFE
jgi:hypothetical protein